jgi:hypothetical protein
MKTQTLAAALVLMVALTINRAYADFATQLFPFFYPDGSQVLSVNGHKDDRWGGYATGIFPGVLKVACCGNHSCVRITFQHTSDSIQGGSRATKDFCD